jgi:hypothetical protein
MGKASRSKRERDDAMSIHQQIAREAAQAATAPAGLSWDGYPALRQLLRAARDQVLHSSPRQFQFEGRTFWLRVSHAMSFVEVFDSPAKGTPLVRTVCGSSDTSGHEPAH